MSEPTIRCKDRYVRKGIAHCMAVALPPYLRQVIDGECERCPYATKIRISTTEESERKRS